MAQPIGALRAELSASIAQFASDMGKAEKIMEKFASKTERWANRVNSAGQALSVAVTAPIVLLGVKATQTGKEYESAMNRVQAATLATADQMALLNAKAREIGRDKSVAATATETALAMEALAKNGLSVTQILDGAARAATLLATANGAQLEPAANLTADVMTQFGLKASQATDIVNKMTGAMIASKFNFDDYRLAIGQAGGFAAGAGVSFEDLNTALAATAAYFGSGSDAGTSYKAFLARLVPQSKEAERTMAALGISFYDAAGNIKPLTEIAQVLKDKVGGLNEEARNKVLYTLFGADAMRTGLALMEKGADGIEKVAKAINEIDANDIAGTRLKGLQGSITRLQKSLENLFLAIAQSGLMDFVGGVIDGISNMADWFAKLPPPVLATVTAIAGVVAVMGPLLVVVGSAAGAIANLSVLLPPLIATFKFMGGAVNLVSVAFQVASVNLKLLAASAGVSVMQFEAFTAAARAALLVMGGFAAILGVAVVAFAAYYAYMRAAEKPTKAVTDQTKALAEAVDAYKEATLKATTASGAARVSALQEAAAKRQLAIQTINATKAKLAEARATLTAAKESQHATLVTPSASMTPGAGGLADAFAERRVTQAKSNIKELERSITAAEKDMASADEILQAAQKPVAEVKVPTGGGASFNIPDTAKQDADRKKVEKATQKFADHLRDMNQDVARGLNELTQPDSMVKAQALTDKLDNYIESAKEAGVNTLRFGTEIANLRKEIDRLKTEGLQKDAEKFGLAVNKIQRAVEEYASGGLKELDSRLQEVDAEFESLTDRIEKQIEENRVLASVNDDAAKSMVRLQAQSAALKDAHDKATEAVKAQYAAEQQIADLDAKMRSNDLTQQITDAKRARGEGGFMSSQMKAMETAERDLAQSRLESARRIKEIDLDIMDAQRKGDTDRLARLEAEKALELELASVVADTTAFQIVQAERLNSIWEGMASDTSNLLQDWINGVDGVQSATRKFFSDLADQLFIKPVTDQIGEFLSGQLKGLYGQIGGWGTQDPAMTDTKTAADAITAAGEGFKENINQTSTGLSGFLGNIFNSLGSAVSGLFGSIGKLFGFGGAAGATAAAGSDGGSGFFSGVLSLFDGLFADGGTIKPGHWGIAGENGPEPIFGGMTGRSVVSNKEAQGSFGGSKTVVQNINTPDYNSMRMNRRQLSRQAKEALG